MSYANHNSINIYYEVEGQGQPLVLVHGLKGDTTYWRGYGYVDQLKEMFTVIVVDMRGHGKSDKPHEEAAHIPTGSLQPGSRFCAFSTA